MRKFVTIAALIMLAGSAGACAKMLGLEREEEDRAFEHRAHVVEGINCCQKTRICHGEIETVKSLCANVLGRYPPRPLPFACQTDE